MRVLLALLLLWAILAITVIAGELITVYIIGTIALILFIGGALLVFSIKPRGYKSATWMTGIAFLLLWDSAESIMALKISFFSATSILELTAIAFILLGIFEEHHTKKYIYATIALFYIVLTILSH